MTIEEVGEGITRLERRQWWLWLYGNVLVGMIIASFALNAWRAVTVETRLKPLQDERVQLLRERADLKAELARRAPR